MTTTSTSNNADKTAASTKPATTSAIKKEDATTSPSVVVVASEPNVKVSTNTRSATATAAAVAANKSASKPTKVAPVSNPTVTVTTATTSSVKNAPSRTATASTTSTTAKAVMAASNKVASVAAPVVVRTTASTATAASSAALSAKTSKKKKGPAAPLPAATGGHHKAHTPASTNTTAVSLDKNAPPSGENVGRWTAEEHRLFLQGLEQHGKGWKKIASLIKTRSVVQIRTHAQKYFQKLAKARQNGEEGDVTMEGRGGVASVTSVSVSAAAAAQSNKRRRQTTGTKRKAIHSVVVSAQREGKKLAAAAASSNTGSKKPASSEVVPPLPSVAPVLAHFVVPNVTNTASSSSTTKGNQKRGGTQTVSTSEGTISGPALEDSIFRFLTPAPVIPMDSTVNDVARQAGANPIALPSDTTTPSTTGGEATPTGVMDLSIYPSWTDAKDTPSWYAKGADVDALLDVGDSLDWLVDTGDLQETYQPPEMESAPSMPDISESSMALGQGNNNSSVSTLPHVDSNVESVVPPLPSLFDSEAVDADKKSPLLTASTSISELKPSPSDVHLQVFENCEEEHEFVSAILETNDSAVSLPALN